MSGAAPCACAACAGEGAPAPRTPDRAFLFRHSQLRGRMLAAISGVEVGGSRPMAALGTRALDDPAVALIDAHAACLHVLAWTAQRLGDDATISRTEDRDALVALTGLLGYQPRPALAASTTLAFTLDDFIGSPGQATIPRGTKVASIPVQPELPQTFETDAAIEARAAWNAVRPLQDHTPGAIEAGVASLWIEGVGVAVRPGDHLLFQIAGECRLAAVTGTERVAEAGSERTRIDLTVVRTLGRASGVPLPAADAVVVLGQRAAPFGSTAPDARLMPGTVTAVDHRPPAEWIDFVVGAPGDTTHTRADLDGVYADAVAGRYTVWTAPTTARVGLITAAEELSRADFGLSAKLTRVTLAGIPLAPPELPEGHGGVPLHALAHGGGFLLDSFWMFVRETTVYVETARATLFRFAVDRVLPTDPLSLDVALADAPPAGRRVALLGETWAGAADLPGAPLAEIAEIDRTEAIAGGVRLVFKRPVAGQFRSKTLRVNANCAPASHGETPAGGAEILGSGAGAVAVPRFTLARAPLAYGPADTPRGYAPAIEVRVDGRRYDEVAQLYGQPADAPRYSVREVAGRAQVQFASRLPGGAYNVTALYRTGGGSAGLLAAGRLTAMLNPVLGVGSATNPVPATGGSDAIGLADLRAAAPRSVQTLDRVVSLADHQAFAREFRGVGKAMASELYDGMRALVVLTVADSALAPPAAELVTGLTAALARYAVPGRKVRVEGFTDYLAVVDLALATDAALLRDQVEAAARGALAERFGRAARRFGEGLHASALLAAVQDVRGVRAARLRGWRRVRADAPQDGAGALDTTSRLLCPGVSLSEPAGLLSIDPARVSFSEMTA